MKVFRLMIEFEVQDDLNLVVGAVTGVDQFDGTVHVYLDTVDKFSAEEDNNANDTE